MGHALAEVPLCAFLLNTCVMLRRRRRRRLWRQIPWRPTSVFSARETATALQSFFATIDRITSDNPVAIPRLQELAGKARLGQITAPEGQELQTLKLQAVRQGRAVAAVIGFFLKLRPYPMLEEIRKKAKLFQPAFGPVLVVEGEPFGTCSSAIRSSRWIPTASR